MRLHDATNKCPLRNCDNKYRRIDHSFGLSLRLSASLIRIVGNSSDHKILSHFFYGKTTWVPKPVSTTVLTVKVTEFIGFDTPILQVLTDPCLSKVSREYFPIIKQEFTKKFCTLKGIYEALIMVQPVKVPQKYFLSLVVVKSNNISIL